MGRGCPSDSQLPFMRKSLTKISGVPMIAQPFEIAEDQDEEGTVGLTFGSMSFWLPPFGFKSLNTTPISLS